MSLPVIISKAALTPARKIAFKTVVPGSASLVRTAGTTSKGALKQRLAAWYKRYGTWLTIGGAGAGLGVLGIPYLTGSETKNGQDFEDEVVSSGTVVNGQIVSHSSARNRSLSRLQGLMSNITAHSPGSTAERMAMIEMFQVLNVMISRHPDVSFLNAVDSTFKALTSTSLVLETDSKDRAPMSLFLNMSTQKPPAMDISSRLWYITGVDEAGISLAHINDFENLDSSR